MMKGIFLEKPLKYKGETKEVDTWWFATTGVCKEACDKDLWIRFKDGTDNEGTGITHITQEND